MLLSYNANVKELQDTAGSEYFTFLSRKAHEGASNQAKVDVANAMMIGDIGVSDHSFENLNRDYALERSSEVPAYLSQYVEGDHLP